ncbi:hypothetical protein [Streptomyces alboflavus]|uniref:hypothetical protein n=1 Tax=Streptomyces alboflavus TaxID=67267 RepID=UPI000F6574D4|nr:hypothetical protein [Streptomyces alboflavus]
MHITTRATQPGPAAAIELFDLVVTGALRSVEAHPDGSWTITPAIGRPLTLTSPAAISAYVDQAHGTGPQALAPARTLAPAVPDAETEPPGCGCVPTTLPTGAAADLMQARAISRHLNTLGISSQRRSVAYDQALEAAVVRVHTAHGLYALRIPEPRALFGVWRNGSRDGSLGERRVPANSDSYLATLYAAYLRERGAL